jgi:PTS system N-acetylglucosamine-specific IIA component
VFSAEMVGPGVAIDPGSTTESVAVAPVTGTIVKLHPHAYVIQTADGAGVLVHLGIDTVDLAGDGFELHVTEGAAVSAGDPIVTWDPDAVVSGGRSAVCPVIALDAQASALSARTESGDVAAGSRLFTWDH